MDTDDLAAFRQRLTEVIAWCTPRVSACDLVNSLRTPALRPSYRPANVFDHKGYDDTVWREYVRGQSCARTAADVDEIAKERARLLRSQGAYPSARTTDLAGGRLLLSAPDYGFYDGASEHESLGFIDVGDAPPWDTWIRFVFDEEARGCFYDSYIVSWVPMQFVTYVDAAIRVSVVDNLAWANDVDTAFTRRLRPADSQA